VGFTVVVFVFEDQQFVVGARIAWLPLWIRGHAADPQPAATIEIDLVWLGKFWKLFLAGKRLDFEAIRHVHRFCALFRRQILELIRLRIVLLRIAEPRRRNEQFPRVAVIRWAKLFTIREIP